jgi:uncharacterized integral membrane protein
MTETSADRAASIQQVLQTAANESPEVKQAALTAMGPPIPPPPPNVAGPLWIILVGGLVLVLLLSVLALTHVIGTSVSDDKIVTIFTSVLAGVLGLFAKSPTS